MRTADVRMWIRRSGVLRAVLYGCVANALLLMSSGCTRAPHESAGVAEAVRPGVESLRARAAALWAARVAEDWLKVYALSDVKTRAAGDAQTFATWSAANEPLQCLRCEIHAVEAEGDLGWVKLTHQTRMRKLKDVPPQEATTWELWSVQDGDWYPVPRQEREDYPAAPQKRDRTAEAQLTARFEAAWSAQRDRDWQSLHALLAPQDRAALALQDLAADGEKLAYVSCRRLWTEVVGTRGRVRATYEIKSNDPSLTKLPPREVTVIERWVQVDGDWYRTLN